MNPLSNTSTNNIVHTEQIDVKKLWDDTLVSIELSITPANFKTWFRDTHIVSLEDGTITLGVPSVFVKDWLSDKFQSMIKSYSNEISFYLHHLTDYDQKLSLPKIWSSNANERAGTFTLLLSDISERFNIRYTNLNLPDVEVYKALDFLSSFHARNWEMNETYDESLLFKRGGICAAFEDEERMKKIEDPWDRLRDAASGISNRVFNGGRRKHRTIVHGDFRKSNILFNGSQCTAVDYQFSGYGYGMIDVVTLICSSVDSLIASQNEENYIKYYFQSLNTKLRELRRPPLPPGFKLADAHTKYEICFLDYCRFYCVEENFGCESRNNDSYLRRRCTDLLDSLCVGFTEDLSPAEWTAAIYRRWPAS